MDSPYVYMSICMYIDLQSRAAGIDQHGTMVDTKISPFMALKHTGTTNPEYNRYIKNRPDTTKYEARFKTLGPDVSGKVSGAQAKADMVTSKLPSSVLHRIWNLSDVSKDGWLDIYEYSLVGGEAAC
jgi:EH domain-containing protein 1